jgi:predicted alpha/beta hydrolase family esterase
MPFFCINIIILVVRFFHVLRFPCFPYLRFIFFNTYIKLVFVMTFSASVFIVPGLGNSGPEHWQSRWEKEFGFARIMQEEWDNPVCSVWADKIQEAVSCYPLQNIVLVGHSSACNAIAYWADKYKKVIKGALLVAPSDSEAPSFPMGPKGFAPMHLHKFDFPTITVTSQDDYYVSLSRAEFFAKSWDSELVDIGVAGHINVASGFGEWPQGLALLQRLTNL